MRAHPVKVNSEPDDPGAGKEAAHCLGQEELGRSARLHTRKKVIRVSFELMSFLALKIFVSILLNNYTKLVEFEKNVLLYKNLFLVPLVSLFYKFQFPENLSPPFVPRTHTVQADPSFRTNLKKKAAKNRWSFLKA